MKYVLIFFCLNLFCFYFTVSFTQHIPSNERGNPLYRTKSQIESNKIRATVFNHAQTGRTGVSPIYEQTPYEWPKNSGQVYMALTGLFIGAEVVDYFGNTIKVVEVMNYRQSPQGFTWNFEPIPGYFNNNYFLIANSNNKQTWPNYWPDRMNDPNDPGWPGKWDGYLGKNKFINGQELYYKCTDNLYNRHLYYPDTTDLMRRGLGLLISVRALEFNEIPLEDIVFYSIKIKNDGTKTLNKIAITNWLADFIGGEGDSQDDKAFYDTTSNLIWFLDKDNLAATFGSNPVGAVGFTMLKSPAGLDNNSLKFNNLQNMPAGFLNLNTISDDELWNNFMTPYKYYNPQLIPYGEYDLFASSCNFKLLPGETTEFILAITIVNGPIQDPNQQTRISEIKRKLKLAQLAVKSGFISDAFNVSIISPQENQTVSGTTEIKWNTSGEINKYADVVFYTTDFGDNWNYLTTDTINQKNYFWYTPLVPDGILNKIQIFSYAQNGMAKNNSGRFIINNPNKSAPPQAYITSPKNNDTLKDNFTIKWISGDADGDNFSTKLFYRLASQDDWITLGNFDSSVKSFLWDTKQIPNSNSLELMAMVIGVTDSGKYVRTNLVIDNMRLIYPDTVLNLIKNVYGTGTFQIRIADKSKLKGHSYKVVFDTISNFKNVFDVFNLNTGQKLISKGIETDGTRESQVFDGVTLLIKSDKLKVNEQTSGWNYTGIQNYNFEIFELDVEKGFPYPSDYKIIFGNVGIDTSINATIAGMNFPAMPVNFKVLNKTVNKFIDFVFIEVDTTGGKGKLTSNADGFKDRIVFKEQINQNFSSYTFWTYLNYEFGFRFPTIGDTLIVNQFKPFWPEDYFSFSTQKITSVRENNSLLDFSLSQNYPNPFNSTTKIRYKIASKSYVSIKVYDILGREVITLVNEVKEPGNYEIEYRSQKSFEQFGSRRTNANGIISSGVYFYQLRADKFVETKKLILIK